MVFPKLVEKWRNLAQSEIDKSGVPLPVELALAIIKNESGGRVGAVNPTANDSGLMQVVPISLKWYNQKHARKYTMNDLQGKSDSSARIQIRIGLWVLASWWRIAYRYLKKRRPTVPLDDLARIADLFYARGQAGARRKIDKVAPNFEAIESAYPDWRPVGHARRIWALTNKAGATWDSTSIDNWLHGETIIEDKKTVGGAIAAVVIIAVAWMVLKKGKS